MGWVYVHLQVIIGWHDDERGSRMRTNKSVTWHWFGVHSTMHLDRAHQLISCNYYNILRMWERVYVYVSVCYLAIVCVRMREWMCVCVWVCACVLYSDSSHKLRPKSPHNNPPCAQHVHTLEQRRWQSCYVFHNCLNSASLTQRISDPKSTVWVLIAPFHTMNVIACNLLVCPQWLRCFYQEASASLTARNHKGHAHSHKYAVPQSC